MENKLKDIIKNPSLFYRPSIMEIIEKYVIDSSSNTKDDEYYFNKLKKVFQFVDSNFTLQDRSIKDAILLMGNKQPNVSNKVSNNVSTNVQDIHKDIKNYYLSVDSLIHYHKYDETANKSKLYQNPDQYALENESGSLQTFQNIELDFYHYYDIYVQNHRDEGTVNVFEGKHSYFGDYYINGTNAYEVFLHNCYSYIRCTQNYEICYYNLEDIFVKYPNVIDEDYAFIEKTMTNIREQFFDKHEKDLAEYVTKMFRNKEYYGILKVDDKKKELLDILFINYLKENSIDYNIGGETPSLERFKDISGPLLMYNHLRMKRDVFHKLEHPNKTDKLNEFDFMYGIKQDENRNYLYEYSPYSHVNINNFFNAFDNSSSFNEDIKTLIDEKLKNGTLNLRGGIRASFTRIHQVLRDYLNEQNKKFDYPYSKKIDLIGFTDDDMKNYFNLLKTQPEEQPEKNKISPYAQEFIKKLYNSYRQRLTDYAKRYRSYNIFEGMKKTDRYDLLSSYFDHFKRFVFEGGTTSLGIGAYLISMLSLSSCIPEDMVSRLEELEFDIKTYPSLFDLEIIESRIESVIEDNIFDGVEVFHQEPYLLGFFTFMKDNDTSGTCQDDALIRLMIADKNNKLNGFRVFSKPYISHWNTHVRPYRKDVAFTIGSFGIRDGCSLGTRKPIDNSNVPPEPSNVLQKVDTYTTISDKDYESRALVFLGITLSHVYRHTDTFDQSNNGNGIAFKYGFTAAVINYIKYNLRHYLIDTPVSSTPVSRTDNIRLVDFSKYTKLNALSSLLNRDVDNIRKELKKETVKTQTYKRDRKS